ncbi:hypothetical protein P154DRAFT_577029 [Amniculicola lignicola CBS 123094]|uniref:Uncharacterized protein n=1 Tax=Amniculicola lignicola CBS 123094 TaxID=1392246 RepID=A0A6A5WCZ3_9PLEO|nr:hypothetical protein P154DRAFT_577029 [Amniculicola lignicola CBS 123094]
MRPRGVLLPAFFLSFVVPSFAIPSISNGGFDGSSLLPYGGILNPSSGRLEIRGVVGGRKKRYIIEREGAKSCCKDKLCKSLLGEILEKNCKCKACPLGQVPFSASQCKNECPSGTVKTPDGKGCCPAGQKQNPTGDACELDCGKERPGPDGKCPTKSQEDKDKENRKGKCPLGQMLDPIEGGQDINTPNPKCVPDDFDNCGPGEIPQTRSPGDNDPNKKADCAKPDEKNRKKCDPKRHYTEVNVYEDGNGKKVASETCKPTRKFQEKKKGRLDRMKEWKQKKWDSEKGERDKKKNEKLQKENEEKDRKDREQKEQEKQKNEQDRKQRDKEGKQLRMGKCLPVVGLIEAFGAAAGLKRSAEIESREGESEYEWVADYFDEDFVQGEDILQYWPSDVNLDETIDINSDAYVSLWWDLVQGKLLREGVQVDSRPQSPKAHTATPTLTTGYSSIGNSTSLSHDPEKRFVQLIPILADLALFAGRMAAAFLSRLGSVLSRISPRLAQIAKNTDRLFKVAPKGQGAQGGREAMKNAATRISKNTNWKDCLTKGRPNGF